MRRRVKKYTERSLRVFLSIGNPFNPSIIDYDTLWVFSVKGCRSQTAKLQDKFQITFKSLRKQCVSEQGGKERFIRNCCKKFNKFCLFRRDQKNLTGFHNRGL